MPRDGHFRSNVRAICLTMLAISGLAILLPSASASDTPDPASVTVVSGFQSELGCPSDFLPTCALTHLTYSANSDVWRATFTVPAGPQSYKVALDDAFDENYGLHAIRGGANIPFAQPAIGAVTFYYDHKSHWATDSVSSTIATAVGSFQSELGCPADWLPDCLRSWLEDPDGDGTYTFTTSVIPQGNYDAKVTINENFDENYGAGAVENGANIPFVVPAGNPAVTFSYKAATHLLTITVASNDTTAPTIIPHRAPAANASGWNDSPVTVSFSCVDETGGSGVASTSAPVVLAADGAGQSASGSCSDVAGNSASTTVTGISIDRRRPDITFAGNAGSYPIDGTVAISCSATDALSGIATSTCTGGSGAASAFGPGSHSVAATAVDRAGNQTSASTNFVVTVSATSLCRLTETLVRGSARYRAARPLRRLVPDALTATGCAALRAVVGAPRQRATLVAVYDVSVAALARGGWLTANEAAQLRQFADLL